MLFNLMKGEVGEAIKKYGAENPPPPAQVFTIRNAPGEGNLHYVQKVFKGAFEVRCQDHSHTISTLTGTSLMSSFLPDPRRSL